MHAHYFMWYNKGRSSYTSSLWSLKNKDQAEPWLQDISTVNLYLMVTLTVRWSGRWQHPYFTVEQLLFRKISNLRVLPKWLSTSQWRSWSQTQGFPASAPGTAFPIINQRPRVWEGDYIFWPHELMTQHWGTSHQSGDILLGSQAVSVLKWMTLLKDDSPIISFISGRFHML